MIPEAELSFQSNAVMTAYREAYFTRYRTQPIAQSISLEITIIKDITRAVGHERAKSIMRHYLKMNGNEEWFTKRGHTLDVLKQNLNLVNASLGASSTVGGYNPKVVVNMRCPRCNTFFDLTGPINEVAADAYLRPCAPCDETLANEYERTV